MGWNCFCFVLFFVLLCLFCFVTPERFTTMVANEGLEKAITCLNQVPWDQRLYIPSEEHEGYHSQLFKGYMKLSTYAVT